MDVHRRRSVVPCREYNITILQYLDVRIPIYTRMLHGVALWCDYNVIIKDVNAYKHNVTLSRVHMVRDIQLQICVSRVNRDTRRRHRCEINNIICLQLYFNLYEYNIVVYVK